MMALPSDVTYVSSGVEVATDLLANCGQLILANVPLRTGMTRELRLKTHDSVTVGGIVVVAVVSLIPSMSINKPSK